MSEGQGKEGVEGPPDREPGRGGLSGSLLEVTKAARELLGTAEALTQGGELEAALEAYRAAREGFRMVGVAGDVAWCDLNQGRLLQALERMAEAVGPLRVAAPALDAAGRPFFAAEARDRLGISLAAAGDHAGAAEAHEAAAEAFTGLGHLRLVVKTRERAVAAWSDAGEPEREAAAADALLAAQTALRAEDASDGPTT